MSAKRYAVLAAIGAASLGALAAAGASLVPKKLRRRSRPKKVYDALVEALTRR